MKTSRLYRRLYVTLIAYYDLNHFFIYLILRVNSTLIEWSAPLELRKRIKF